MTFVFGQEEYLVHFEVKKILKRYQIKANFYDETATVENIIADIATIPMFSNQKVIVIKDHPIFIEKDAGNKFLQDLTKIRLQNVKLIFVLTLKYQNSNPLIKYLMANADLKAIKDISNKDLFTIIYKIVAKNGAKISQAAIIKLIQKLPLNLRLIISEVKKLLLESKNITEEQVNNSVDNYYSEDYFALSNAIIDNNPHKIVKYYNEKIEYGQDQISIIAQIGSALSLSVLVNNYKNLGFSLQEISDQLKIHIFRIQKANQLLLNQDVKKIDDLIIQLANLESDIKTKSENSSRRLEKFILELIK